MQLRAARLTCISNAVRRAVAPPAFTPLFFFSNNEQGIWLDPSDFSTMFQDAAGTTPVTAVEQPVGLILDKSRGLVLGPELVTNGDFSDGTTGWTPDDADLSSVGGKLRVDSGVDYGRAFQVLPATAGKIYRVTAAVTAVAGSSVTSIQFSNLLGTGGGAAIGAFSAASGSREVVFYWTAPETRSYAIVIQNNSPDPNSVNDFDNISVRELPGNHATQATATSRPILRQDASGRYYLFFDGIDDSLVTGIITPGTDKVQVFVGVRKLSDATGGVIFETATSSSFDGALRAYAGNSSTAAGPHYTFETRGTLPVPLQALNSYAAPITNILTGIGNISGDSAILRINGTQVVSSIADQGTGNYLAYPLYIGRRAGTSLPANIQLYQLTARFGPNLSIETIQQAETFFNSKTGAF